MKFAATLALALGAGLWFTPDQLGMRRYRAGDFAGAAEAFADPMWRGCAQYRAKDFEGAARSFARLDTPEAHYDRGNALVMLGRYQAAIESYERALAARPEWTEARENRDLARARYDRIHDREEDGGQATEIEADEYVVDPDASKRESSPDESDAVDAGQELGSAGVQALWLQRVQTKPADFLRAKFAFQEAARGDGAADATDDAGGER